jgi:hypothetical protein
MNSSRTSAIILAFALTTALAPVALAEGSNPQGTVGYTGTDVGEVLVRLEKTTGAFADRLDDSLDQSVLNDTTLERRLNNWAEDLEDAADEVKDEFEDGDAVRPHVAKLIRIGAKINDEVLLRELDTQVEADWTNLRADLNKVAKAYGEPPLRDR